MEDYNPCEYVRNWQIEYRKSKWPEDDWEEQEFHGTFYDVLERLKEIMSKGDIYTDFTIKEVD